MCFSAEASFTGAVVIGAWGVGTLALVKSVRELPYAALPLAFALHQALEGISWLELGDSTHAVLDGWGVQYWILFAWALLPTWVPLAVLLIEPFEAKRRQMVPLLVIGAVLSLFMATQVVRRGVEVSVAGHALDYVLPFSPAWLLAVPYVMATCLAPFVSSWRYVRWFGVGNIVAMSAAALIEAAAYSSIWCTFAAFLSGLVFWHFWATRDQRGAAQHLGPAPV